MKESEWVDTKNYQKFLEGMAVLEDTGKGHPGLLLAIGQAGRGKTEAGKRFATQTGAVVLRVQEDWTPRAMLAQLCWEINRTEPRSVAACKKMITDQLRDRRQTILVDEADRLRGINMIEHFRDIHDISGAPVALVGENILYSKMRNARSRLWSRVTQVVEFGPISEEDIMVFGLKFGVRVQPDAARCIAQKTDGDFRLVYHDMRDLSRMAVANSTEVVSTKMVGTLVDRKVGPVFVEQRGRR